MRKRKQFGHVNFTMTTHTPNIAVYADVQNLYYTTRDAYGRSLNYRALMQRIRKQGNIVCAIAYAIARDDNKQHQFQDALRHIGFEVKLKPYIQRSDGSAKGDWDVGITIDVMSVPPEVDTVILLSGDGDFALLLETIRQNYGMRTEVYSVQALTANALIQAASVYHPITEDLLI